MNSPPIRLAAISGSPPLSLDNIPAGPRQVTRQFASSSSLPGLEHEARLALYTLFQRFVMPGTLQALGELDEQLAEAGVLPNLPARPISSTGIARSSNAQDATAPAPDDMPGDEQRHSSPGALGDEMLLRVRDLLSARRAHSRPSGAAQLPPDPPAPISEVLAAINNLPGSPAPPPSDAYAPAAANFTPEALRDVRHALFDQRSQLRSQLGEGRISPDIDDVIEIIGAIFEMMLNEQDLPDVAKALLSHLHTPYLKYAVADPELLGQPQHPARDWLDDMVRVGSHWVAPSDLKPGLYPWMADAASQGTQTRPLPPILFETRQTSLTNQEKAQHSKQKKRGKRVGEYVRGRARIDQAQDQSQAVLDRLLVNHPGAQLAVDFLEDVWVNYMVLLALRANNDLEALPVRGALVLGSDMCDTCAAVARGGVGAKVAVQKLDKALSLTVVELTPHLEPKVKAFLAKLGAHQGPIDATARTSGTRRQHIRERVREQEVLTEEEQTIANTLRKLPAGTRFWRKSKEGKTDTTLRLIWFNPQTLRFMFADLAGENAGMVSLKELASDVAQGRARALEERNQSFFDKALHSFQSLL